jgi:hypothetical protein
VLTNDQAALLAAAAMAGLTHGDLGDVTRAADWLASWLDERDRLAGRLPLTWHLPDAPE